MPNDTKPGFKLGITGGIGSGKTSVCRVFNVLGIPFFSADPEAKLIMDSDTTIMKRINSIAGKDLYEKGALDRMELAKLIFNDNSLLEKVNSLVHPVVFEHFRLWEAKQNSPYVIIEAAIMFESGADKLVDRIATIVAPIEERVDRVKHRNNLSREQVLERMRNQMDDESRIKLSDYVIYNSENDMIIPAILKIHEDILNYINSAG
ncbi:MAG: dephospho-CoA kinase [Bacteroidales bacterium]|nr:dephospho-CoA kinase [Bacteroidales bacterium]